MNNPKLVWTVAGLLGLLLSFSAIQKFTAAATTVDDFMRWGYGTTFMVLTGIVELSAVVLLLVPRVRAFGATLVLLVMLGAGYTHLIHGEFARLPIVVVVMVAAFYLGWVSRNNLMLPKAA